MRLLIPWTGAWLADVDVDLDDERTPPSGRVTLKIGDAVLVGTVDPRASGVLGDKGKVRVIGGAAGWHYAVAPRHFHNDAGVLSTAVLAATAAEVSETVVDAAPVRLGIDWVRSAGPASRAFGARDWWVDLAGVTHVGVRAATVRSSDVEIMTWDPNAQRAELAADTIVLPGTPLADARLGISSVVRDVEQTFGPTGARAVAWCGSSPGPRLVGALASLVRETSGIAYARPYRYRIVSQEALDGRVTLQAISPAAGVPDVLAITIWAGMSGLAAKLTPGSEVIVDFVAGEPSQPVVRSFDAELPIELHLDASSRVVVGTGAQPIALATSAVDAIKALQDEIKDVTAAFVKAFDIPGPIKDTHATAAKEAAKAVTKAALLVATATQETPSTKLFSE